MALSLTDLGQPVKGLIPLIWQITAGGKQFVLGAYQANYQLDYPTTPILFAIFNLEDNTGAVLSQAGTGGDFGPYPMDQLANGNMAVACAKYSPNGQGTYYEIDLVNKAIASYHSIAMNTCDLVLACKNGYVIMASGTEPGHQYVEWYKPGVVSWTTRLITTTLPNAYTYASSNTYGGHDYAYVVCSNYAIAIRMDNGVETTLLTPATNQFQLIQTIQVTLDGGTTVLTYLDCFNKYTTTPDDGDNLHYWYRLDGLSAVYLDTGPSYPDQYWHLGIDANTPWFVTSVYTVDYTNILPASGDATGTVGVSYIRGGNNYSKSITGVVAGGCQIKDIALFPFGIYLTGENYGPTCKLNADNTSTYLGYASGRTPYELRWCPNWGEAFISGYDSLLCKWNPTAPWVWPFNSDGTAGGSNPFRIGHSLGGGTDHWVWTVTTAVDKKIYFGIRFLQYYESYNPANEAWIQYDLGAHWQIYNIQCIRGGTNLVINAVYNNTDNALDPLNKLSKIFLHDILSGAIIKSWTLSSTEVTACALVEVQKLSSGSLIFDDTCEGHILAVQGYNSANCKAWRINTYQAGGSILTSPSAFVWGPQSLGDVAFGQGYRSEHYNLEISPTTGLTYLPIGNNMFSINPANGTPADTGLSLAADIGVYRLKWIGKDMYAFYGNKHLYKVSGWT